MVEKTKHLSKKREAILNAGVRAFLEMGYDNTSMDYIAEVAGASKRTVYNHFPSKEVLFEEVLNRFINNMPELKQVAYSPKRSLENQLDDFALAKIAVAKDPAWLGLMKVASGVFIRNPKLVMETVARALESENTLPTWLEAAHADGRLKVKDGELAADVFWSMIDGAFFWRTFFLGPMKPKQENALKKELVQTFLSRYRS